MMTNLSIILALTERAGVISRTDPHGWILSLVSISVVFCALAVLYLIYNLIGNIASGRYKKKRSSGDEEDIIAAIAFALDREEVLHRNDCGNIHDAESYVITIRRKQNTK